ncbi:hypothetical protein CONPUDRAFT_159677 [Coniophora puteana RWD-64-598 SS2]|uniref:Thioredoxin-like protein n=1 Tax=Coniophora puteana (strain RWD-64-598) TaxID=741705 RepID=A0A5M3M7S3_CONPW|nr:uncharacterized protein CONPUDRAFT_159677 [Coniophora puteana RWD-64-598 SS2]EIW74904.1 hypothetical protein CONPUDRAFT_159677 [Coniophora puteana RWD-64-598 SS2]
MPEQLTLYGHRHSSTSMIVAIALSEAKAEHTFYEVDLRNKPAWFAENINPAGKVPAITYGGPTVPPDQPSPQSTKLAESLVLVELVADLHPAAGLLPSDPLKRAKVRFFVTTVQTRYLEPYFHWFAFGRPGAWREIYEGARAIQALLPESGEGYAVGEEFTTADCVFAPAAGRTKIAYERGIGRFPPEEAVQLRELMDAPEMARFRAYVGRVLERPSVKANFGEDWVAEGTKVVVELFNQRDAASAST